MNLVHWPLMGALLRLVQRGENWVGPQSVQALPRCTKCNSPPVSGQCTNHRVVQVLCSFNAPVKGLNPDKYSSDRADTIKL